MNEQVSKTAIKLMQKLGESRDRAWRLRDIFNKDSTDYLTFEELAGKLNAMIAEIQPYTTM